MIRWVINALALYATAWLLDGVDVSGFGAALVAAAVLAIVNAIIRPVLILLTLPVNILTLGLFTFVINGGMLLLVGRVVRGFEVSGLLTAVVASLILTVISAILNALIGPRED
jgi:putative membrane protein